MWQWPPMPDNSSDDTDNDLDAVDVALSISAADAKPCRPSTFTIPKWTNSSDSSAVNQSSKARSKQSDTASSYDQISPDWVVKSSTTKPVVSISSYTHDSTMSAEEAEQHALEDEWDRREARRDAKRKSMLPYKPVHVFLTDEENDVEIKDTDLLKSYRSEDDEEFPSEFRSVLGPAEPLSRSMSSMTNTSSNPSSTRPSSSSSSQQRTAPM